LALALALALAAVAPAPAHDVTQGDLMVVHPMSRPIMAGRTAAVYMAIANDGETDERFLGARSPAFEAVELHESYEENGIAKMRPVEVLEIPAGDTALLEPGGLHLMLFGAKQAVAAGETFPLVLIFEQAGEVEVPVMVDEMPLPAGHDHSGHSDGHGQHAAPAE
ncbi:MAG TPA: copper chaperone PCu(A)C, partial [Paracoccaceae bacterium]|nr:copper chaperone PCu(A)C [Paracoccaceae bacterium]